MEGKPAISEGVPPYASQPEPSAEVGVSAEVVPATAIPQADPSSAVGAVQAGAAATPSGQPPVGYQIPTMVAPVAPQAAMASPTPASLDPTAILMMQQMQQANMMMMQQQQQQQHAQQMEREAARERAERADRAAAAERADRNASSERTHGQTTQAVAAQHAETTQAVQSQHGMTTQAVAAQHAETTQAVQSQHGMTTQAVVAHHAMAGGVKFKEPEEPEDPPDPTRNIVIRTLNGMQSTYSRRLGMMDVSPSKELKFWLMGACELIEEKAVNFVEHGIDVKVSALRDLDTICMKTLAEVGRGGIGQRAGLTREDTRRLEAELRKGTEGVDTWRADFLERRTHDWLQEHMVQMAVLKAPTTDLSAVEGWHKRTVRIFGSLCPLVIGFSINIKTAVLMENPMTSDLCCSGSPVKPMQHTVYE
jgi:hypothetical protein